MSERTKRTVLFKEQFKKEWNKDCRFLVYYNMCVLTRAGADCKNCKIKSITITETEENGNKRYKKS